MGGPTQTLGIGKRSFGALKKELRPNTAKPRGEDRGSAAYLIGIKLCPYFYFTLGAMIKLISIIWVDKDSVPHFRATVTECLIIGCDYHALTPASASASASTVAPVM